MIFSRTVSMATKNAPTGLSVLTYDYYLFGLKVCSISEYVTSNTTADRFTGCRVS